jgi:hypothetical protein
LLSIMTSGLKLYPIVKLDMLALETC